MVEKDARPFFCALKIIRRLIKLAERAKAEEAKFLADCDVQADANFQLLDALEAEDDARQNQAG